MLVNKLPKAFPLELIKDPLVIKRIIVNDYSQFGFDQKDLWIIKLKSFVMKRNLQRKIKQESQ